MKRKFLILSFIFIVPLVCLIFFVKVRTDSRNSESRSHTRSPTTKNQTRHESATEADANKPTHTSALKQHQSKELGAQDEIELNSANFEAFVKYCFAGESCRFTENPMGIYNQFRLLQNTAGQDALIAFLRSKMSDEEYRSRYKSLLHAMIKDFYPPQERALQEAAFHYYVGELEKSLELYLDLERRAQADSSFLTPPPLNIANTLFDLKRHEAALRYYQAARTEYLNGTRETHAPGRAEMIDFIETRIAEIKRAIETGRETF